MSNKFGTKQKRIVAYSIFSIFAWLIVWMSLFAPPSNFPSSNSIDNPKLFSITEGETLGGIASDLKQQYYIRSEFVFTFITRFVLSGGRSAVAEDYFFEAPLNVYSVAKRIVAGTTSISPVRITIPEGLNKFEMSQILASQLPNFDAAHFVEVAPEGYLFPDTYFFSPKTSADQIIKTMRENFDEKIATLEADIEASGRTLEEIVKMASIVETEARQMTTRKTIAGILWKRLDLKMPLQVDVSFKYINGKNTYELTDEDLEIDSPYNSYLHTGLPPTPIANPGLDSLQAAASPLKTDYLFFLSDRSGTMYYAKTFDQHKENRKKL